VRDVTALLPPGTGVLDLIEGWARWGPVLAARTPDLPSTGLDQVRLLAPIPTPRRDLFAVGKNYREHVAEFGRSGYDQPDRSEALPEHPVVFTKATTSVTGPYDDILPHHGVTSELDYEAELGVIIGRGGRGISRDEAFAHVWGYTVVNDVSWRDLQRRHGGQWHKGKSLDGSCPMGPWIVTADSLDAGALDVACRVNGVTKQESNTRHMYFKLPRLIADLSGGQTLEAGDIISTGTPEGVGFARTPAEFMKPGDLLETEIAGIGVMRNPIG
jgi:2-keto-4-pentenoate hydratase/2-oxohepta-3-ene-1,7-dioic acid hydratase in catechol pathway